MSGSVLNQYLDPRAVCLRIDGASAEDVIGQLAARLETLGVVKPSYRQAVIRREAEMPTGLPLADDFAVAVPHTDPEHVIRPGLAIATLAHPVAFRSMDDPDQALPVSVVFALALKDKHQQIAMLQTIAGMLQDAGTIRRLAEATTSDELLRVLGVENAVEGAKL